MTDRTFFVRVNLDDMATDLIGLDSTDERGLWLEGFVVGSRGKDCRVDWPAAKLEGHSFGLKCFNEAEEFRDKQSAKGHASADARRNRKSTVVQPDVNHGSTTVQPDVNQTSTHPTTNIQQPTTKSEKPKKARQAAFDPSMFDELLPEDFSRLPAFVSMWHAWVSERKERKSPMTERAAKMHIEKLVGFGAASVGIEAMRQAIEKRWTALYLPKDNLAGFTPAQQPRPAIERVLTYEEEQMRLPMSQRWKT